MEQNIMITAPDGKIIYGTLAGASHSKKLIIFVHGLTDHQNNHLFYNARKFYLQYDFWVFTFDLYSWRKDARKFKDCTLLTQAQDVNTVWDYFKEQFSQMYLVGHSLGCPTILLSRYADVKAIIFWDPSYEFEHFMDEITRFDSTLGVHLLDGAYEIVVRDLMHQSLTAEFPDCFELVKNVKVPLQVIVAGGGLLLEGAQKYYQAANEPKQLKIITGATHGFDEEGTEEELFRETLAWLQRF